MRSNFGSTILWEPHGLIQAGIYYTLIGEGYNMLVSCRIESTFEMCLREKQIYAYDAHDAFYALNAKPT